MTDTVHEHVALRVGPVHATMPPSLSKATDGSRTHDRLHTTQVLIQPSSGSQEGGMEGMKVEG